MSHVSDLPVIIGTAGHVDHGKTTLIRALTGVETDRLAEEQRRGMTIDLGFAPFTLPSGRRAGVVDVPGHEKFLKNMLAGAGGIDLVLLVVAADDGVMPQTREHLEILSLLRVAQGLVVMTKTDLVDPELLELAIEDVRESLAGTFMADAPILPVSAPTGAGLPALIATIETLTASATPRDAEGPPRLPIDRVFVKQGFGTVVTGTLLSGTLREGDAVELAPGSLASRVRGLQVHGEKRSEARAGQRVAINLAGLEKQAIGRGDWVVAPHALTPSTLLDVQLEVLPDAPPIAHRTRIRLHHGTAERIGRVVLLDRDTLMPGESAPAQLVLEQPVVAAYGDRFVLRRYAPQVLLGGGRIMHASPAKHKRKNEGTLAALAHLAEGDPLGAMAEALKRSGKRPMSEDALLGFVPTERQVEGRAWLAAHAFALGQGRYLDLASAGAIAEELRGALAKFHQAQPWRLGLRAEELAQRTKRPLGEVVRIAGALVGRGELSLRGRIYSVPAHQPSLPPELDKARSSILQQLAAAPLADQDDFTALGAGDRLGALLEDLVEAGTIVRISGGIYADAKRLSEIKALMRANLAEAPFTASQARELIGTNRKYIIPFLEFLDSQGVTRRQGDVRALVGRGEG